MIKSELDGFSKSFGLCANLSKSAVYLAGTDEVCQAAICEVLGMPFREIPYLRVPLSHKKLTISQYSPLVDKISAKINHWSTRLLSHATRNMLIKSMLTGIHSY